ncbi:hypothetical protein COOONC_20446, partial [Cooperia oncophora]
MYQRKLPPRFPALPHIQLETHGKITHAWYEHIGHMLTSEPSIIDGPRTLPPCSTSDRRRLKSKLLMHPLCSRNNCESIVKSLREIDWIGLINFCSSTNASLSVRQSEYKRYSVELRKALVRRQMLKENDLASSKNTKRFFSYCRKNLKLADSIPNLISQGVV